MCNLRILLKWLWSLKCIISSRITRASNIVTPSYAGIDTSRSLKPLATRTALERDRKVGYEMEVEKLHEGDTGREIGRGGLRAWKGM